MKVFRYKEEAKQAGFTRTVRWIDEFKAILVYNNATREYAIVQ